MKLALIGNCSYQALIDDQSRIKWLCWPRFDSSFVFGSLLDETRGGEFAITPAEGRFVSQQGYLPNTNIIRTHFRSAAGEFTVTDFAPRFLQFQRSFKPTMLVRHIRRVSGTPNIRVCCDPTYDYGRARPTCHIASNHIQWHIPGAQLRLTTNAPLAYVHETRSFALESDLYFVLTWGQPLEASLKDTCESFLSQTKHYWETWVKHASIPERFQEQVIRSALALKLHQFEDTGAITAATTTSIPEHPGSGRTWDYRFCWPRDTYFTLRALRRLGHFEEMEAFVAYLGNIAEASPDRLQPVYGISGEREIIETTIEHLSGYLNNGPVRAGNDAYRQTQHDVYGEMIASLAPMFLDVRFHNMARERSTSLLRNLLTSIETYLESPDAGLWEKRQAPKLHTFSLLMHWAGATVAHRVGVRFDDTTLIERSRVIAERASKIIETKTWRPNLGFYADSVDSSAADASLMMMVNLGYLPAGPRAESHIRGLAKTLSATDHLLYRYLHNDGIGETYSTFTVCGFWYAEALARLGHVEEAERIFATLLCHANHVGLLSEDIDPKTGELWGNFPQTYSHVGIINTAFAISPILDTL